MKRRTYLICSIFITIEVLFYNSSSVFLVLSSVLAYLFILYNFFIDKKVGLTYYLAFTLLSFGSWSYVITETPNNFWGLRASGISFNILVSLVLLFFTFISKDNKFDSKYLKKQSVIYLYLLFILLIGIFNTVIGVNYVDNFFVDFLFIITIIIYNFLISIFKKQELFDLFRGLILISIYGMFLSFVLDIKFEYSGGFIYILLNSLGYIIPFSFFLFRSYYSKKVYFLLILILLYLILSKNIFISGKLITIYFITIFWVIFQHKKDVKLYITLFLILFFSSALSLFVSNFINSEVLFKYKFEQIENGLKNFDRLSESNGSFQNILAEFYGINKHFSDNPTYYFTGKGIGAGIPDYEGLLSPIAGGSGYKIEDLKRNNYHGMHISLLEIYLKGGVLWGGVYLFFIFRYFKSKEISSFILFILLLTVYDTTKEMLLLIFLLYRYEYLKYNE